MFSILSPVSSRHSLHTYFWISGCNNESTDFERTKTMPAKFFPKTFEPYKDLKEERPDSCKNSRLEKSPHCKMFANSWWGWRQIKGAAVSELLHNNMRLLTSLSVSGSFLCNIVRCEVALYDPLSGVRYLTVSVQDLTGCIQGLFGVCRYRWYNLQTVS